jgi:hypothetical protein
VDPPRPAVETVESLQARGYRFAEIDASERETLACNVLSLGKGRLVALAENEKTNLRLRAQPDSRCARFLGRKFASTAAVAHVPDPASTARVEMQLSWLSADR